MVPTPFERPPSSGRSTMTVHRIPAIPDRFKKGKQGRQAVGSPSPAMWVRLGESEWFAIPPQMADSFRKAGGEVRQTRELP